MTDLVACLGAGKGTWAYLLNLIESESWENVFLITNPFGAERFSAKRPVEFIIVDENKTLPEISENIKKQLEGKIKSFEVAVNFVSGEGKEHMALVAALIKLGIGIRFIALTPGGIVEI